MMNHQRNRKTQPKSRRLPVQKSNLLVSARKRGKREQLNRPRTDETTMRKVTKVNGQISNHPRMILAIFCSSHRMMQFNLTFKRYSATSRYR